MAGKHRGEARKGKATRMARTTLDRSVEAALQRMMQVERRSRANAVSVLVTEALMARTAAELREGGR